MEIIFKTIEEDEEVTLGKVIHDSFVEILLPSFQPSGPKIVLRHIFQSRQGQECWTVNAIESNRNQVVVQVTPETNTQSLLDFAESQDLKNLSRIVRPYNIVEVDFGFYSNLYNSDGEERLNTSVSDKILPGEMHKRRPCIVLGVQGKCLQVIPLSTKEPKSNLSMCIEISESSFNGLASRYQEKRSYALLGMIQSVSAYRVFPPRNARLIYEHRYFRFKLTSLDKLKIKEALATQYNKDVISSLENQKRALESLQDERKRLLDSKVELENRTNKLNKECELLKSYIFKIKDSLGLDGDSIEEVIKQF